MAGETIDIIPLMSPERVLGALLWALARGELPDDLLLLVDNLPRPYKLSLSPGLARLVDTLHQADLDEERSALVARLQADLRLALQNLRDLRSLDRGPGDV